MKNFLTSKENLEFKRIDNILDLRQDTSSLILIGSNSKNLSSIIKKYFFDKYKLEDYKIISDNILYDLAQENNKKLNIINLYENKNIEQILKKLQFSRDFISEFNLKIIFIFDSKSYTHLTENCIDFYNTNSFAYNFIDHSYLFDNSKTKENSKLNSAISKYNDYISNTKNPSKKNKINNVIQYRHRSI